MLQRRLAALETGRETRVVTAGKDVRKVAKRLRYVPEAGAEALPVDPKPALRAVQDLLGEFQDALAARERLCALGGRGRYIDSGTGAGDGQRRSMRGRAAGDLARSPPCTSSVMDLAPTSRGTKVLRPEA